MERERIEAIRTLGDRLADYIPRDPRMLRRIHAAKKYSELRWRLVDADLDLAKNNQPPLLSFDGFVKIFEESEAVAYDDWSLARDLILIRIIERLYEKKTLDTYTPQLEEMTRESETREEALDRAL